MLRLPSSCCHNARCWHEADQWTGLCDVSIDPELDIAVLDINAKLANDWFVRVSIYIKAALFSAKEH